MYCQAPYNYCMTREFPPGIRYDSEGSGDLVLDVPNPGIQAFGLDDVLLQPSDMYPCALVPVRDLAAGNPEAEEHILAAASSRLAEVPVSFHKFTKELYVCRQRTDGVEHTNVIGVIQLVGLITLQLALQEDGVPPFTTLFPHITILRSAPHHDIRISSTGDLTALCRPRRDLFGAIFADVSANQIAQDL